MQTVNCWEFMNCGRERGGAKIGELGLCPVAEAESLDGLNGGTNGGRACWCVAGTLCRGQVQGTFAQKFRNCLACMFFKQVRDEQGVMDSELLLQYYLKCR